MKTTLKALLLLACSAAMFAMGGCVESASTGLICPPGTHPGPYGHRCFTD